MNRSHDECVAMRAQHYPNCENASSRSCRCRWCSGTRHGWEGALKLATSDDPVPLREAEEHAERDWRLEEAKRQEKLLRQKTARITFAHKAAAMGSCLVEVIGLVRSWSSSLRERRLATAPSRPDAGRVEQMGRILGYSLKEVERNHPALVTSDARRAMTDHFWCEVLAQLAHEMDQGLTALEQVPDKVSDMVIRCRKAESREVLEDALVRAAVDAVWKRIQRFAAFGVLAKGRVALLALRILAIFVCKQPERHRAVIEHCVDPLGKELVERTKERLLSVLGEWLPGLRSEAEGA